MLDGTIAGNPAAATAVTVLFRKDRRELSFVDMFRVPGTQNLMAKAADEGGAKCNLNAFFCAFKTNSAASKACS